MMYKNVELNPANSSLFFGANMNLKKEVSAAALLAIILGTGLGYATYSFVTGPQAPPVQRALDLYTQQLGVGTNQSGGIFAPNELVQLSAYLTANGLAINETEVSFIINDPAGYLRTESALTDNQGVASINLNLTLSIDESAIGLWAVTASAQAENETITDSLTFECRIHSTPVILTTLDLYTQRGGLGSGEHGGIFEQEEVVQFFAYLTSGGSPVDASEVNFTITDPMGNWTAESELTDSSGKASINYTLPWQPSTLGNWTATAVSRFGNETVSDSTIFESVTKQVVPPVVKTLDLYTQQGGVGPGDFYGGVFSPGETLELSAYLTRDGNPINETEVDFTICQYAGTPVNQSALTDSRGIANWNFTIPYGKSSEGNWTGTAVAYVDNESLNDSVFIGCQGETETSLFVTTKKDGELCVNFSPLDYVAIAVHAYAEMSLLPLDLKIDVLLPNGTFYVFGENITTDTWGDAVTDFQIPQTDSVLGTWSIQVSCEAHGKQIWGYANFNCLTLEMVLDVYTQNGGRGQNFHSGPFSVGQSVNLYAIIEVSNSSINGGQLVAFEVKFNETTFLVFTAETNSSRIASANFTIPADPSFVGTWEVYARVEEGTTVLLDTLVFAVDQPQT